MRIIDTYLYCCLLINFVSRPHRGGGVVPSGRLFLKSGCNSDRPRASKQVFRRDQWAPCTHVCASQCDINIAIIIYVLSLHPRWDAQNKPMRKHPPRSCTCVPWRAPGTGCDMVCAETQMHLLRTGKCETKKTASAKWKTFTMREENCFIALGW